MTASLNRPYKTRTVSAIFLACEAFKRVTFKSVLKHFLFCIKKYSPSKQIHASNVLPAAAHDSLTNKSLKIIFCFLIPVTTHKTLTTNTNNNFLIFLNHILRSHINQNFFFGSWCSFFCLIFIPSLFCFIVPLYVHFHSQLSCYCLSTRFQRLIHWLAPVSLNHHSWRNVVSFTLFYLQQLHLVVLCSCPFVIHAACFTTFHTLSKIYCIPPSCQRSRFASVWPLTVTHSCNVTPFALLLLLTVSVRTNSAYWTLGLTAVTKTKILSPDIHGVDPPARHTPHVIHWPKTTATVLDTECFDRGFDIDIWTFETRF